MFYIIQENVFRETNYNLIFETLTKLGLEFEVIKVESNSDTFEFKTDRKDVFTFGSIRMAKLSAQNDWNPGSFFGNNHDYSVYSEHYKENLLNYDCEIKTFGDKLEWFPNELKFIRPCKDSKLFNGSVFSKIKWEDKVEQTQQNPYYLKLDEPQLIQIGTVKTIYKEARVWIVDGKVVTSSYYRYGQNVEYTENVEPEGLEFAQSMVDLYQVAECFVMDICLTPDGWKIVEINCINCSGFYKGDLQKIVIALENKYSPILEIE
jgi:hypothetical protein